MRARAAARLSSRPAQAVFSRRFFSHGVRPAERAHLSHRHRCASSCHSKRCLVSAAASPCGFAGGPSSWSLRAAGAALTTVVLLLVVGYVMHVRGRTDDALVGCAPLPLSLLAYLIVSCRAPVLFFVSASSSSHY